MENEQNHFRILVIDDNPNIHHDITKMLANNAPSEFDKISMNLFDKNKSEITLPAFQIDSASQGQEGVACLQKAFTEEQPYSLVFVDIRMPPGWDGIETIKHIWKIDQDIQVVICTAFSDYSWEETVSHLGQTDNLLILKKPFDTVVLRQLACALTKKYQLTQNTKKDKAEIEKNFKLLQKSVSLLKATLESSNNGVLVINNDGGIVDYNQNFLNMWRIPRTILDEKNELKLDEFMIEQIENPGRFTIQMDSFSADPSINFADKINLKDGKIFEYYTQPQQMNEQIIGRVFDFRDITQRSNLEKSLAYQATHDALTDLPNRTLLFERVQQEIKTSEKKKALFAVLFADLDRFKFINDSLSHAEGDTILKSVANRLKTSMRPEDTLARLGGDEFVIILTNFDNEEDIKPRVQKFIDVFQEPFTINKRKIIITISIGVSLYPKHGETIDILLRNADAAMYAAKGNRRNTFQLYTDELNQLSLAQLNQEMELRQALVNNEFFLSYQPQIDLRNGRIVAVEALIRWKHPKKGILHPLSFLPLAEKTGLIVPIDGWVLREACKQNKLWQEAGFPPVRVAVNASTLQFTQQNIVEQIAAVLAETKLDSKYLELELTENLVVSSPDIVKAVEALKKLGVCIAIDDFGSGYSALSYLKKLPLDRIKIDGSFVQHIQTPEDDEAVIRAILAMAKNLNLEVVAEGVENQNQVNFLQKYHCDDLQGFYFSKAVSPTELIALLKKEPENFT